MGTVNAASALLLPKTAMLRYTPDSKNGETATLLFRAWDTTAGTAGGRADLSVAGANGGATAFSSATDTASLTVTSVNDAPVLMPAGPSLGTTDDHSMLKEIAISTFVAGGEARPASPTWTRCRHRRHRAGGRYRQRNLGIHARRHDLPSGRHGG